MLKTLNDHLAERSPESVERINGLAEALAHAIPINDLPMNEEVCHTNHGVY